MANFGDQMTVERDNIIELVDKFKGGQGLTIPVLQSIQSALGYLPMEAFAIIEERIGIPASKAYGVATFYSQFRLSPIGKHLIKACDGTACHVKGSQTLLTALKDHLELIETNTSKDNFFTLEEVACLGCCSLAPVMMIDETTYGNLTIEKMKQILSDCRKEADG